MVQASVIPSVNECNSYPNDLTLITITDSFLVAYKGTLDVLRILLRQLKIIIYVFKQQQPASQTIVFQSSSLNANMKSTAFAFMVPFLALGATALPQSTGSGLTGQVPPPPCLVSLVPTV